MARDIQHVVYPPGNAEIACLITQRTITREVITRIGGEIRIDHALVITVNGADLRRPGPLDHKIARPGAFDFSALLIEQGGLNAEEGKARKPGFQLMRPRKRGNHHTTRLGLPPGVNDRAPPLSHHPVIPLPGFRINRLPDGANDPQGASVMTRD